VDEWGRWAASPAVVERLEYWERARSPRRPVPEFDVSQLRPESVCIWLERGDGAAPLTDITQRFVVLRDWTDSLAFLLAYEIPESSRRLRAASDDPRVGGSPGDAARLRDEIWETLGCGGADDASVQRIRDDLGRLFSEGHATCRIVAWGTVEDVLRSPEVYGHLRGAVAADEAEGDGWSPCLGLKFCTDNGWFDDSPMCLEGAMEFFSREASSNLQPGHRADDDAPSRLSDRRPEVPDPQISTSFADLRLGGASYASSTSASTNATGRPYLSRANWRMPAARSGFPTGWAGGV